MGGPAQVEAALRPPEVALSLDRMGSAHATRLSFLRVLLRIAARDGWRTGCSRRW